ncbi:MAG: DUF1488 family protein [Proteobacteria bacterium]|nr:DUF1488 family protein [Pseudomonadota bacterium]
MKLSFPNSSRSYDAAHKWVRFWAYDESLEVPFFVDAAALQSPSSAADEDELSILENFDRQWIAICAAAERVYTRRSRGSYLLRAADLARAG